jgi:hypothetical protein
MAEAASAADVLRKTREMLRAAQRGLADLLGDEPTMGPIGLYNIAVFGRSVTLVLQNLRTIDRKKFDEWYAPHSKVLSTDPLFYKYFNELRNEILKEGPPDLNIEMYVPLINDEIRDELMANRPPGARGFFIGDRLGGSGWQVVLPDGTEQKYYVKLPPELGIRMSLHLPNPPTEHLRKPLRDTSIENLTRLYVNYLSELVADAEKQFGS